MKSLLLNFPNECTEYESSHRLIIDCHSKIKIHRDLLVHSFAKTGAFKKSRKRKLKGSIYARETNIGGILIPGPRRETLDPIP